MRKSPDFLECRAVIGQQSVYTTNLWYRIHAGDMCSYTLKYADQLTFCWLILLADEIGQLCHSSDIGFTVAVDTVLAGRWCYNEVGISEYHERFRTQSEDERLDIAGVLTPRIYWLLYLYWQRL